jgi:hypothetical protein
MARETEKLNEVAKAIQRLEYAIRANNQSNLVSVDGGWITSSGTMTYSSVSGGVSTVTVSSGLAAVLQAGVKVKCTNNSSVKYFLVKSVSGTTVQLVGESDMANSAITAIYYSYSDCPLGFPYWINSLTSLGTIGSSSSDDQTLSDNTVTKLDFESTEDPGSCWSDSTNEYEAKVTANYLVTLSIIRANGSVNWVRSVALVYVDGSQEGTRSSDIRATTITSVIVSAIVRLEKGEKMDFRFLADVASGSPGVSYASKFTVNFYSI